MTDASRDTATWWARRPAQILRWLAVHGRGWRLDVAALILFAASRLVVVIAIDFGPLLLPEPYTGKWLAGPQWYHRMVRWDGRWYGGIVTDGYQYSDAAQALNSINFFPLYPLVSAAMRVLARVDPFVAMLLVANLCSVIVVLLLVRLVKQEIGEESVLPTVALFSFFPSSMFLSAAYSESLCLVFVLLSLILLARHQFVVSAAMAGVSLAARSTSIVLLPVILSVIALTPTMTWPQRLSRIAVCGVLAASGLLAYMAYLWIAFGHPLAFVASQDAFHAQSLSQRIASAVTLEAFRRAEWPEAVQLLAFVLLAVASFWRLRFSLALYGIAAIAMPYLLDGVTRSTGRYLLACFPAFMLLGWICRTRPWLTIALTACLAALLFRKTALFSQWYWEG
ncbi:hypothetical protein JQ626_28010 [Bradyrhizobium diazoefficiens]|nr:mannosyltransferase family protein [Bradyrhizobium diazoefficiens]MBR0967914.1 hypothetical protein [Bradyrhizobium diazoefficiens]MBR0981311.1 hypothetical protein [Bradyrhizobium diazoefficiens]MBR1010765.1 hypothetical protein [Bradyrhizobium diazoefficiens]MBR1017276.1 hypothetical protein [Bradyrhizobium diazoefficiens]MBR1054524.1 hypothetical protein [Bradyrhizobium diazoefficiens]